MSGVEIRPATPTPSDIEHFVTLAEIAGHNLFEALLGPRWKPVMTQVARHSNHDLSVQAAHLMEVDGRVAGLMSGMPHPRPAAYTLRTIILTARYGLLQLPRAAWVGLHMLPLLNWFEDVPDGAYYISMVAIYPKFRGRGLSAHLMDTAIQQARLHDCTILALDTGTDNTPAIAMYHKSGFHIEGTSPAVQTSGGPHQLHRLVCRLDR